LTVCVTGVRGTIVYQDLFNDGDVSTRYTALGGSTLVETGGRLDLRTPVAVQGDGIRDGVRIDLENLPGGEAICHKLEFSTDGNVDGSFITWKWIVREPGADPFMLLQSEWTTEPPPDFPVDAVEEDGDGAGVSFYVKTTKLDDTGNPSGTVVYEVIPKDMKDLLNAKSQWDRRSPVPDEEEVQLEFLESDGVIVKLFPWRDPPPTLTVSFEICTDLDVIHFESVVVEDEHVEPVTDPYFLDLPNTQFEDCPEQCYFVTMSSPTDVLGLTIGLRWEPADAIHILSVEPGSSAPQNPLFFNVNIEGPTLGPGAALIAYAAQPGEVIPAGENLRVLKITLERSPEQRIGTPVRFCFANGLGVPPQNTILSVLEQDSAVSITPGQACGIVSFFVDSTPPIITTPENITVECPLAGGTVVDFEVTAEDGCGSVNVECTPPSGSGFPPGTTVVICTAVDDAGNIATASFEVEVGGAGGCFIRSEINGDGTLDLSDGIAVLVWLFQGGRQPICPSAVDVNDDGGLDMSDALYIFGYHFLGRAGPPEPFPECGPDPTRDEIEATFGPCEYPPVHCN